jgi:hypothetical protein
MAPRWSFRSVISFMASLPGRATSKCARAFHRPTHVDGHLHQVDPIRSHLGREGTCVLDRNDEFVVPGLHLDGQVAPAHHETRM